MPRRQAPANDLRLPVAQAGGQPAAGGPPGPRARFRVNAIRAPARSARLRIGQRAAKGRRARRVGPRASAVSARRVGPRASAVSARRAGSRESVLNARRAGLKASAVNEHRAALRESVVSARPAVSTANAATGHPAASKVSVVNARRAVRALPLCHAAPRANAPNALRDGRKANVRPVAVTQSATVASDPPVFHAKTRAVRRSAPHAAPMTPVAPARHVLAAFLAQELVASVLRDAKATPRASAAGRSGRALALNAAPPRNVARSSGPHVTTRRAAAPQVRATNNPLRKDGVRWSAASARLPNP
jgi:hypothetical protein